MDNFRKDLPTKHYFSLSPRLGKYILTALKAGGSRFAKRLQRCLLRKTDPWPLPGLSVCQC